MGEGWREGAQGREGLRGKIRERKEVIRKEREKEGKRKEGGGTTIKERRERKGGKRQEGRRERRGGKII